MSEDTSDRNDEIWALAQAGMPHSAIAEKYKISRARVGQIVAARTPAQWGYTDAHRAAVRYQEAEGLKRLAKAAGKVVSNPPPRSRAIGKIVRDPRAANSIMTAASSGAWLRRRSTASPLSAAGYF